MLQTLMAAVLQGLPSQCAVCQRWPAKPLCEACIARFNPPVRRCPTCALRLPPGLADRPCGACLRQPNGLDRCLCAVDYAYPWSDCIARLKFRQQPGWARTLARLMAQDPQVQVALQAASLVLPIPLSRQRLQARGYNQALLLAQALCPQKTRPDGLLRVRDTPAQAELPWSERQVNLKNALMADPLCVPGLQSQSVVLVDDVMTTGATLTAAAQALRSAGVRHITGLVFARTPAAAGTAK